MIRKERQSNLELLRILCMFGVLIVHADFGVLDTPTKSELTVSSLYCISRSLIESFAVVSVNTFVLLSGWFGIKFNWQGLAKLLFQCFFFFFLIYGLLLLTKEQSFSIEGLKKCLMLTNNVWFVKCYVGLYIISPVLNSFVNHADKKMFKMVLILFFVFQSVYGWFFIAQDYILNGYSAWSFMGLYLLARYVRIHSPKYSMMNHRKDIMIYFMLSLLSGILMLFFVYLDKFTYFVLFMQYSSPLVIAASLFLLLYFSKLRIQSRTINWIAASCFAVYLSHFYLFSMYMRPLIQNIYHNNTGGVILFKIVFALAIFYVMAILVDKLRIFVWEKIVLKPFAHDK